MAFQKFFDVSKSSFWCWNFTWTKKKHAQSKPISHHHFLFSTSTTQTHGKSINLLNEDPQNPSHLLLLLSPKLSRQKTVRPLKRFSFTKIPCKYTHSQSNGLLRYKITKRVKTFYNVIITYWGGKKSKWLLSGTLIQIPWQTLLSYLNTYYLTSIGIEWTCSRDSKEFVQVKEACCAAKITGNCAVNAARRSGERWQLYDTCTQVLRVEF